MLRIRRDETTRGRILFRLDGRLGPSELEVLTGAVEPSLRSGQECALDLAELRFLDDPGGRYLSALRRRGVKLAGASGYVAELLRALEDER